MGRAPPAIAPIDLEEFYWFTMRMGEIGGTAEIELSKPTGAIEVPKRNG